MAASYGACPLRLVLSNLVWVISTSLSRNGPLEAKGDEATDRDTVAHESTQKSKGSSKDKSPAAKGTKRPLEPNGTVAVSVPMAKRRQYI